MRTANNHSLFAHQAQQQKVDTIGDPLHKINSIIDFKAMTQRIDHDFPRPPQDKGGRPRYATEVMVRVLFIKRLYNLSYQQTEFQLCDRHSFKRFALLTHSERIPDENTIRDFDEFIGLEGAKALFDEVDRQINQHGFAARGGQIIDATLVTARVQHFTKEEKELLDKGEIPEDWSAAKLAQKDLDATWTTKHGKSTFGYKMTVNVDNKHKLIRSIVTSTAAPHDVNFLEEALDEVNTCAEVYADKGYVGEEYDRMLQDKGLRNSVMRKAQRNKPLSTRDEARNKRISGVRARVEHVFAGFYHLGRTLIRSVGQARADFGMWMNGVCYNLKRLTYLVSAGYDGFHVHPKTA